MVRRASSRWRVTVGGLLAGVTWACVLAAPAGAQDAASEALHEAIDRLIGASLSVRQVVPAGPATDAEFMRRIYLDLAGTIPTLGKARAFLDDTSPIKRQQLIDRLLAGPEFARHMARVFDAMLMERRPANRIPQAQWEEYLRASLAANKPWHELVRELLAADGADPALRPAARFYLDREVEPNLLTRDAARLLLGMDVGCAQCHDHPLVSGYLQADYYGLLAFFNRSSVFVGKDQQAFVAEKADGDVLFKSVFVEGATDQPTRPHLPGQPEIDEPRFDPGQEYAVAPADGVRAVPNYSRRAQLAALLPRAETAAFKRNIANRLWALLMGRGLVHPLDMHHGENPASHPELLDLLAERFAALRFDLKGMLRELALSQTYQRSSQSPDEAQRPPPESFAVAPLKPLSAEQLAFALMQATGLTDIERAALGAALNERALDERIAGNVAQFVALYGGQPGQGQEEFQATLEQTLFVSNGETLRAWLAPQPGNLVDRLSRATEVAALADELYLSVLSRRPDPEEVTQLEAYLKDRSADRPAALAEVVWALLASAEFRFNY